MKYFFNRKTAIGILAVLMAIFLLVAVLLQIDIQLAFADSRYERCYKELKDDELEVSSRRSSVSNDDPQITVFVHAFGGAAYYWSNDGHDNFAYDKDSMPEQLRENIGRDNSELYVIKINYDLTNFIGEKRTREGALSQPVDSNQSSDAPGAASLQKMYTNYKNTGDYGISLYSCNNLNGNQYIYPDIQTADSTDSLEIDPHKHIILIFDQWSGVTEDKKEYGKYESNDFVYSQLEYCLDVVSYEYRRLTGELPTYNLIAHSRGGLNAMQYALAHPYNVASIYTMGTPYDGTALGSISFDGGETYPFVDLADIEKRYQYSDVKDYHPGVLDIIENKAVTDSYRNYWNEHYNQYFSHIKFSPIGSYVTVGFVIQTAIEALCTNVLNLKTDNVLGALAIGALRGLGICTEIFLNACSLLNLKGYIVSAVITNAFNSIKSYAKGTSLYPFIEAVANFQALPPLEYKHIGGYSFANYVYLDDLFINLDSQVATGYKGRDVRVKSFDSVDQISGKKSMETVGVAHNLETRNKDIINYIVNSLNTGASEDFQVRYAGEGCYITNLKVNNLNAFIPDGRLEIPETFKGHKVIGIDGLSDSVELSGTEGNLTEIKEIIIPSSVKTIGENAFLGMSGLEKVTFTQNNIEEIGDNAFAYCTSLKNFQIGAKVKLLGLKAFYGCENLQNYSIQAGSATYRVNDGILYSLSDNQLISYPSGKRDSSFTVPGQITQIASGAFIGNQNLRELDLNQVTYVDSFAFAGCNNVNEITAPNLNFVGAYAFENTLWQESQSGDFVSLGNVLVKYNGNKQSIAISDYSSIAAFAFSGNTSLQRVEIGNGVVNVGDGAFFGCENLDTVYITNLNNLVYVGNAVFGPGVSHIYVPGGNLELQYFANEVWENYSKSMSVHETVVSFESNGGSGCSDVILSYGEFIGVLPKPVRDGYTFAGWYLDSDFSGAMLSQTDVWKYLTDSITVYAKWQPVEYQIVFATEYSSTGITEATTAQYTIEQSFEFPIPEKIGYVFGGWYLDIDCTQPAGTSIPVGTTGDKTYYAKWIADTYKVKLDVNDSDEFPATISNTEGEAHYGSADYTFAVPARTGFTFNGWYALVGNNKVFMTGSDGKANQSWEIAEDVTLYADWTRNQYFIKINSDDKIVWLGSNGFTDIQTSIEYGTLFATVTDMEQAFNPNKISLKAGHKFDYFTLSDGTRFTLWDQIASMFNSGDTIEIVAHFTKEINFSINFLDFKASEENPFVGTYGDEIKYLPVAKEGYKFQYWIVADNDYNRQNFNGTYLEPGTIFDYTTMPDLSVNREEDGTRIYLQAKFTPKIYTIRFNSEYGTVPASTTITFGTQKKLPVIDAPGLEFLGWRTAAELKITDGSGNMLDSWDIPSDQDLYAEWKTIEYSITYVLNEGNNSDYNPTSYDVFTTSFTLDEATRSGYRFMGWYLNKDFTGDVVYLIPQGSVGDLTLYAKWAKIYYVYFDSNGGTYVAPMSGIEGETIILPSSELDRYKGTWEYWGYLTNDNSVSNFGYAYTIGSLDVTLTVAWKQYQFTVTFDQNGGVGESTDVQATYGEMLPHVELPKRAGYNFVGYYTSKNGGTCYYDFIDFDYYPEEYYYLYDLGYICDFTKDTTLYAQWELMTWNVSVMGVFSNKGSAAFPDEAFSLSGDENYTFEVPGVKYYKFVRWEYSYENGYLESGTNRSIDMTNFCVGNYSEYTFYLYYDYVDSKHYEKYELDVAILDKNSGTWLLQVTNETGSEQTIYYNKRMCFYDDAKNWSGLNDILSFTLKNGATREIEIQENLFATSITISYIEGNDRKIFYADNLNASSRTLNAYENTINKNASSGSCVAEGTLITLADGSQKPVEMLTGDEILLVWNMFTGTFDVAPILFIDSDPLTDYTVISLTFSDGTTVEVISEHGFWDFDLNKYVYLDENASQYIGHWFNKQTVNADGTFGWTEVQLTGVEIGEKLTVAYSPVTYGHLCYYVNGMLSMPGGIEGLFNIFEVYSESLRYDEQAMAADIEQYGLFTYEEFAEILSVPEEIFNAFNGEYLKVAIGKGLIDFETLTSLVERYQEFF